MKLVALALASSLALVGLSPAPESVAPPITSRVASTALAMPDFDGSVHPRLLGNASSFSSLAGMTTSNDRVAELWKRTSAKAVALLSTAPLGLPNSGDVYAAAQTIYDRTTTLSIALQVTRDTTYATRLWQEWSPIVQRTQWSPGNDLANATLAEGAAIAYDSGLSFWDAPTAAALSNAIARESLTPAANSYQSKSGWTTQAGNYNIVTNAGYAIAAIALSDQQPQLANSVYTSAMTSLKQGMLALSGDGGFSEGYQYWTYAMQHLVTLGRALRFSTGSDQGVFSFAGMASTGNFELNMFGPSGQVFNFGDSKAISGGVPSLFVLADEYSLPVLRQWAYEQTQRQTINQFAFLWYKPGQAEVPLANAALPLDARFAGNSVATLRSSWSDPDALFIGTKTANPNNNLHPQLDAGSFVLDALGQRWATDLGPDDYGLPGYFDGSPTGARWNYYRNRAEGNNALVLADPKGVPDQNPFLNSSFAQSSSTASGAYVYSYLTGSATNGTTTWKRGVELINGRTEAVVEDEVVAPSPVDALWSMHTQAVIDISADGKSAVLTLNGKQMLARIASPATATFSQTSSTPQWSSPTPAGQATNDGVRKLVIANAGITRMLLTVQFTPLHNGVPAGTVAPAQVMSAWSTPGGASLTGLAVDGSPISGFRADTLVYSRDVSPGSTPTVTATAASGVSVRIAQAQSPPGLATITVTGADGKPVTYRIYFRIAPIPVIKQTASSSSSLARLTVDGDLATKWVAAGNQTLQYQFANTRTLTSAQIYWVDPVPANARISINVSSDGTSWQPVYSSVISTSGWSTYPLPPTNAQYVQFLTDLQSNASTYIGIAEVRFFDQPVPQTAAPPITFGSAEVKLPTSPARVGDTLQATVSATAPDGSPVDLSGDTVTWRSADPSIATVSPNGAVTVKAAGSVRIGTVISAPNREYLGAGINLATTNPWLNTFKATADTYVSNVTGQRTTNFGTSAGLFVKNHPVYVTVDREAYLRFDASTLVGKTIVSARLRFVANTTDNDGTNTTLLLQSITSPWDEMSVTYATKPTLGPSLGSAAINNTLSEYFVDVTDYVRASVASGSSGAINVAITEPSATAGLLSLIYGKDSSRAPWLEVTTAYEP